MLRKKKSSKKIRNYLQRILVTDYNLFCVNIIYIHNVLELSLVLYFKLLNNFKHTSTKTLHLI